MSYKSDLVAMPGGGKLQGTGQWGVEAEVPLGPLAEAGLEKVRPERGRDPSPGPAWTSAHPVQ